MTPLSGEGQAVVSAPPGQVWAALLDPAVLRHVIPGADRLEQEGEHRFRAVISFGVGRLRGRYDVILTLSDLDPTRSLRMAGTSVGWLGWGRASGRLTLHECVKGTLVRWSYEGKVEGPVGLAGPLVLGVASKVFVRRVFAALARWQTRAAEGQERKVNTASLLPRKIGATR